MPPDVDRALALAEYDGTRSEDQGGPGIARVLEDLATLPFLSDRRVVVVREADSFVTAHRERLEKYVERPAPTGVLVLDCRTFPKTTRLAKAITAGAGQLHECKKLAGRALLELVLAEAELRGKRFAPDAAARLIDLVGQETGVLVNEIEKLALYVGDRRGITLDDVGLLVGQSREEKVFAALDAAAAGQPRAALQLWHQVLATDPAAAYKALGGIAFKLRQWITAQRLLSEGEGIRAIAPKVMMWGRESQLQTILRRLAPTSLRRALAAIAELDSQAKSGSRSIETGVELLLVRLASPAPRR